MGSIGLQMPPPPHHFSVATPPSCPNAHLLSARGRSGITVAVSNTDPPGLGMLTPPFSPLQHQPGTEHSAVCAAMTIFLSGKKKSWPFGGTCGRNVKVSTERMRYMGDADQPLWEFGQHPCAKVSYRKSTGTKWQNTMQPL